MKLSDEYDAGDFAVVRSPLLPFRELEDWPKGVTGSGDGMSYAECRKILAARLGAQFSRSELREALFFAAPVLERQLDAWLARGEDDVKLERTLTAYFTRLSSRETPFGTFAGVSLVRVGTRTLLELAGRAAYRRHTRPGMGRLIRTLVESAKLEPIRSQLRYEPNRTLHEAFGRTRFSTVDLVSAPQNAEFHPTVDVEASSHVLTALHRAQGGATLAEIAVAVQCGEIGFPAARAFAHQLVEHGLLVPTWVPAATGPEPFAAAQRALSEHPDLRSEAARIGCVRERLAELDRLPLGADVSALRALRDELDGVRGTGELSALFQADLVKPAEAFTLSHADVLQIARAADLVQRTSAPQPNRELLSFRQRFVARYGDRWVPLVEALDADLGIGFGSDQIAVRDAWIDDLVGQRERAPDPRFTLLDQARFELLVQTLRDGDGVCELDAERLARFPRRRLAGLPESFAVLAQLGRDGDRLQIVCPALVAPSAAAPLARFCHADPALERALRSHVEREQTCAGDRLLADVVYLPHGHFANVVLRPTLRSYEILCGGKSGAPEERQISLSDLQVRVVGAVVCLRSKRLDRAISVRITNAHNFEASANLPIYRFLGALQESECGDLASGWSWGALAASAFLPRVACGDVVLSRARWTLAERDLRPFAKATGAQAFAEARALRARLNLPRWVSLIEDKGPLVVDLENCLSVEVLVHALRAADLAVLEELVPLPSALAVQGPEGAFVSEVLVPFTRKLKADDSRIRSAPSASLAAPPARAVPRSFAPGSEWLYLRVFTGPSAVDAVLQQVTERVLPRFLGAGVTRWFFLPYAEGESELRLRFRGDPATLVGKVLPEIHEALQPMLRNGEVWRLQIDTYEREIERYGDGAGIELAEELFWIDSDAVSSLIAVLGDDADSRWQLTLVGIDRLFADLGFNVAARAFLAESAAEAYRREFDVPVQVRKAVGNQYRLTAEHIQQLLWQPGAITEAPLVQSLAILDERSRRLAPVVLALRRAFQEGAIRPDGFALARSFAHMYAVRLLGTAVRSYELVIYDFLARQYATRRALRAARPRPPTLLPTS